jgi:hypothetical protein
MKAWPTVALGDVLRRSEHMIPLDLETTYKASDCTHLEAPDVTS